jgi:acyl dehydratase
VIPGASARFEKTVSEADVALYLGLGGDELPEYSVKPPGLPRPAPSIIALGYASTAFSQLLNFTHRNALVAHYQVSFPSRLRVGDTLTTTVTVVEANDRDSSVTVDIASVTQDCRTVAEGRVRFRLL